MDTSTPVEPKRNGVMERLVGRVKEGIRTNIRASGFDPLWRPYAGRHFAVASSVSHHKHGCPCIETFEQECKAPNIPFGALVWFLPTVRNSSKVRPGGFGAVAIKGLFLAYHVHTAGTWSGDYEVAELDSSLDNPGCTPREAKTHRASRVEFYPSSMVFPIGEVIDTCERRAERCKTLFDVLNAHEAPAEPPSSAEASPQERASDGEPAQDNGGQVPPKADSSGSGVNKDKEVRVHELLIPEDPRDTRGGRRGHRGQKGASLQRFSKSTRMGPRSLENLPIRRRKTQSPGRIPHEPACDASEVPSPIRRRAP